MQVRRDDPTNPAIAALLAAHVAEQRGAVPEGFSFALDGRALSAPEIAFFIAWNDGVVAGMGAVEEGEALAAVERPDTRQHVAERYAAGLHDLAITPAVPGAN